jgi:hypothetical protein
MTVIASQLKALRLLYFRAVRSDGPRRDPQQMSVVRLGCPRPQERATGPPRDRHGWHYPCRQVIAPIPSRNQVATAIRPRAPAACRSLRKLSDQREGRWSLIWHALDMQAVRT